MSYRLQRAFGWIAAPFVWLYIGTRVYVFRKGI